MCEGCSEENAKELGEELRHILPWDKNRESIGLSDGAITWSGYWLRCGYDLFGSYLHGVQRAYGEQAPKGIKGLMYTIPMFGPMNPLLEMEIVCAVKALAKRKGL